MELRLEETKMPDAIPDGTVLPAVVETILERESPFKKDDGSTQMEVNFRFRVTSGEYKDRVLFGTTPTTFSTDPRCKLRVWVQEIMGMDELPANTKVDTDHLQGLTCNIVVAERFSKGADGKTLVSKNRVQDVKRDGPVTAEEPF